MVKGATYDVMIGGGATGTKLGGLYQGGSASGGTKTATATTTAR